MKYKINKGQVKISQLVKRIGITLAIPIFILIVGGLTIIIPFRPFIEEVKDLSKIMFWNNNENLEESKFLVGNKEMYRPSISDNFGKLIIPTLNYTNNVFHGDGDEQLKLGIGHYAGSAIPGEEGNFILTGQRESGFKILKEIKIGDEVIFEANYGIFKYKVSDIQVVEPDSKIATKVTDYERLTMYTGYPFDSLGQALKRIVVICDFIDGEWKE